MQGIYAVYNDDCDRQLGCIFIQKQPDGHNKQIANWLRPLTYDDGTYDKAHQKCLAVTWAVLLLRPYLEGTFFIIRMDLEALKGILNSAEST